MGSGGGGGGGGKNGSSFSGIDVSRDEAELSMDWTPDEPESSRFNTVWLLFTAKILWNW